jgi:hypothetical protein
VRLYWTPEALADLEELAERARTQAERVVDAMEWMAAVGFSLGRPMTRAGLAERYWSVPPQGVYYYVDGDLLIVTRIHDARRRRRPW